MKNFLQVFSLITLVSLLLFTPFSLSAQENIMKILSYNIYHGEDPLNPGNSNLDSIADFINQLGPDLVLLQEVDSMTTRSASIYGVKTDLLELLALKTGMKSYFAKAMDYAEGGYGEGILYKKGISSGSIKLPTPAGGEPRSMAWVEIEIAGKHIGVGGTHLCHQFEDNQAAQVNAILEFTSKKEIPVIWGGDLNFKPTDPEYSKIPSKWSDAARISNNHSPTYSSSNDSGRIDYIWFESDQFELVEYQVFQVNYSDHFPVLATFKIK